MKKMENKKNAHVLDTSAIIGKYVSRDYPNFITSQVFNEVKDFKSRIFLETALNDGILTIMEPDSKSIGVVESAMSTSGDVLRLSEVDKGIAGLAVSLQNKYDPIVFTDDYSLQNVLKILKIGSKSILTKGINDIYSWFLVCKGCKKEYPPDHKEKDCGICGSVLIKRRKK
jgi:UPF0271 protein